MLPFCSASVLPYVVGSAVSSGASPYSIPAETPAQACQLWVQAVGGGRTLAGITEHTCTSSLSGALYVNPVYTQCLPYDFASLGITADSVLFVFGWAFSMVLFGWISGYGIQLAKTMISKL